MRDIDQARKMRERGGGKRKEMSCDVSMWL